MNHQQRCALLAPCVASAIALSPLTAVADTGAAARAPAGVCSLAKGDPGPGNRPTFDLKLTKFPRNASVKITGPDGPDDVKVSSNGSFTDEDVAEGDYKVRENRRNAPTITCTKSTAPAPVKKADVVDVSASVVSRSGKVTCPNFKQVAKGSIQTATAGDVKYRWVRGDGARSGLLTLNFEAAGTKNVPDFSYLPDAGAVQPEKIIGTIQIVIEGEAESSNKAGFTVECQT
ncbi:hypothetical protein [Streptomyces sp. NPDC051211]|uniref:hypothetical protein n=1 Tax=Streptomyces sp. NPDC051211 TaxID=3154643 RepID=UPI00344F9E14